MRHGPYPGRRDRAEPLAVLTAWEGGTSMHRLWAVGTAAAMCPVLGGPPVARQDASLLERPPASVAPAPNTTLLVLFPDAARSNSRAC